MDKLAICFTRLAIVVPWVEMGRGAEAMCISISSSRVVRGQSGQGR